MHDRPCQADRPRRRGRRVPPAASGSRTPRARATVGSAGSVGRPGTSAAAASARSSPPTACPRTTSAALGRRDRRRSGTPRDCARHPDLFWGLRGGKATLGIITAVELDLLPLSTIYGAPCTSTGADTTEVSTPGQRRQPACPSSRRPRSHWPSCPPQPFIPPCWPAGARSPSTTPASPGPEQAEGLLSPMRGRGDTGPRPRRRARLQGHRPIHGRTRHPGTCTAIPDAAQRTAARSHRRATQSCRARVRLTAAAPPSRPSNHGRPEPCSPTSPPQTTRSASRTAYDKHARERLLALGRAVRPRRHPSHPWPARCGGAHSVQGLAGSASP